MKHIVFVHSAGVQSKTTGSNPLINKIQSHVFGYEWHISDYPREQGQIYEAWLEVLLKDLATINDEDTVVLIGHSFGGSVIMKYLTENEIVHKVKQVIMIGSPFWGHDEKFSDPLNKLKSDASKHLGKDIEVYHIQSTDDDRVDFSHQAAWKNAFPRLETIQLNAGQHEFHDGIEVLYDILN